MNKNGKKISNGFWFLLALVAVAAIVYFVVSSTSQSQFGNGPSVNVAGCSGSNPTIALLATNSMVPGTSPTVATNNSIYAGSFVGSIPTSLQTKVPIDVLATASGYLNAEGKIASIGCGTNNLPLSFTPYQAPTLSVYTSNYAALGLTIKNETSSSSPIQEQVKLVSIPYKSTGQMLIVVDYGNKTEVLPNDITLTGENAVSTPTWYSPQSVSSSVASFLVPAVENGATVTYPLTLNPESGQSLGGADNTTVKISVYTLNPVVLDTHTGTFMTTNTWQNSLGANTTIATITASYSIQ